MNQLQQWMQMQRELEQTQWDWIRHHQKVKSEERFKRAFGYPGEHPDDAEWRRSDDAEWRRYCRDKQDDNET